MAGSNPRPQWISSGIALTTSRSTRASPSQVDFELVLARGQVSHGFFATASARLVGR